jgi:hypothetical protein
VQAVRPHDLLRLGIAARDRRLDADPVRLAQDRRVRPMRLLGVARAGSQGIDDDGHALTYAARLPVASAGKNTRFGGS